MTKVPKRVLSIGEVLEEQRAKKDTPRTYFINHAERQKLQRRNKEMRRVRQARAEYSKYEDHIKSIMREE
jgi:hypothetical protein